MIVAKLPQCPLKLNFIRGGCNCLLVVQNATAGFSCSMCNAILTLHHYSALLNYYKKFKFQVLTLNPTSISCWSIRFLVWGCCNNTSTSKFCTN